MKALGAIRGASINAVLRTVENEAKDETGAAPGARAQVPRCQALRTIRHAVEPATLARVRPARQVANRVSRAGTALAALPTACG
ncbi:hypothetical protein Bxe_A0767 [Paraburkholderia xenovorans LB400]|uniref:Uncharacterized protein n=1 Tax=Paraburkholderia xenovorans (strain LB400) TaxID=266265 RepID=Q13US2_PARXL|nr:hypothetical protein Bxe_A0767 [Paraburkholderia xenovorans LB400]